MGMTCYRCPAELPEGLPGYLAGCAGFEETSVERRAKAAGDEAGAFTFVIRRGEVEVKVNGGTDAGGVHAMIMGGSLEKRLKAQSNKLYGDVEKALVAWGARAMDGDEIAALETDW